MEAVGVSLAIVPLVLKGAKGFRSLKSLVSYKKYCEEVEDFIRKLKVQESQFIWHCKWLLGCVEADYVVGEVGQVDLTTTTDDNTAEEYQFIDTRLMEHFGSQYTTFAELLNSIAKHLTEIQNSTHDLRAKYQERQSKKESEKHRWLRQFKEQLRLTFSRSRLLNFIKELRENNEDFLRLRQTIVDTHNTPWTSRDAPKLGMFLHQFELVREASSHLYNDMSCISKCAKHSDHSVSICLEDDVSTGLVKYNHLTLNQRVSFDMGLLCENIVRHRDQRPLSLRIESSVSASTKRRAISSQVLAANSKDRKMASTKPLQTEMSESCPNETDRQKSLKNVKRPKRVTFDDGRCPRQSNAKMESIETPIAASLITSPDDTMPNLCGRVDFCAYLERRCDNGPADVSICVGYLQSTTASIKHLVYRPPIQQDLNIPISLFTVLSKLTKTLPYAGLKSSHRILIARSLASFVLQFCTTPWLPESWSTRDILLLQQEDSATPRSPRLPDIPRLKVHFPCSKPHETLISEHHRNPIIYRFGIALMELGFQRNISDLQIDEEGQADPVVAEKSVIARLDKDLDTPLGIRYADIIRKCISTARESWVNKYDIASVELQSAFYKDVVQELADLENAFHRLDMNG